MKSEWITHKGVRIFHLRYDCFGDDSEGLGKEVGESIVEAMKEPPDSILELVDVTDTTGSRKNVEILRDAANQCKSRIRKVAVLGISGVRQLIAQGVARITGMNFTLFDDIEKAKDFLVENK